MSDAVPGRRSILKMTRRLIAASGGMALLLAIAAGPADAAHKPYTPKPGHKCEVGYKRETKHKHGRKIVECVWVGPSSTKPSQGSTSPVGASSIAPQLSVSLDPSFTQNPSHPLDVTYTYAASASEGGAPLQPLPAGVLEFFSDGLLDCSTNVGGSVTGSTCAVMYAEFGLHTVDVIYDSGTNSATTGVESEDIEPPPVAPITVSDVWGTTAPTNGPAITATVTGQTADVTLTDGSFEGATSVTLTDQLGDACTASVSGTSASCSMQVTGMPTSFTVGYPGGVTTTSTQTVAPWGVDQIQTTTTEWPAETITVTNPTVTSTPTTVQATVSQTYTVDATTPQPPPVSVTFDYSAANAASGQPLPTGQLTLTATPAGTTTPAGQCTADVDGSVTSASCEMTLQAWGEYDLAASYSSGVFNVVSTEDVTSLGVEPPPLSTITVSGDTSSETPTISAVVIGPTASVTATDSTNEFEGATSVTLSDQLGDSCTAPVYVIVPEVVITGTPVPADAWAGTSTATCSMQLSGTPTSFTVGFSGGTTTSSTQTVDPWGVSQPQTVHTDWSASTYTVADPSITATGAIVQECGYYEFGPPEIYFDWGQCFASGGAPWPSTITTSVGEVNLLTEAFGTDAGDSWPANDDGEVAGYLTYGVVGIDGTDAVEGTNNDGGNYTEENDGYGPDNPADCSEVTMQAPVSGTDQPYGGCYFTFDPGTYRITVNYVSEDPNYASTTGPSVIVDVTG